MELEVSASNFIEFITAKLSTFFTHSLDSDDMITEDDAELISSVQNIKVQACLLHHQVKRQH